MSQAQASQEVTQEKPPTDFVEYTLRRVSEKLGIDWKEIEPIIKEVEEELGITKVIGDVAKVMDFQNAIAREFGKAAGPATAMAADAVTSEVVAKAGKKVSEALDEVPVNPYDRIFLKFTLPFAIARVAQYLAGDGDKHVQMLIESVKGYYEKLVDVMQKEIEELKRERQELLKRIDELEKKLEKKQREEELEELQKRLEELTAKLEEVKQKAVEEASKQKAEGMSAFDILREAKKVEEEVRQILEALGYKVEPAVDTKRLEEMVKKAYEQGYKSALEKVGIEQEKIKILSKLIDRAMEFVFSLIQPGSVNAQQANTMANAAPLIQELRERLNAISTGGAQVAQPATPSGEEDSVEALGAGAAGAAEASVEGQAGTGGVEERGVEHADAGGGAIPASQEQH